MNTFDLVFKQLVEYQALVRVSDLETARIIASQPDKQAEEIKRLARQESEHFYQSGRILFVLKASWVGTHEQITETYFATFVEGYQIAREKNGSSISLVE